MKLNFLKGSAFISLIALIFSSCLKDDLQEPIVITDPPMWYSNSAVWEETERKSGAADWETVPSGNRLNLWWDADTIKASIVGAYKYNPTNFGIGIDSAGYIQIKDDLLSFITVRDGGYQDTTATVEYLNYGDTSLVIRNTSVTPYTEIRYRKVK